MTSYSRGQRVIGAATHYVENQPDWRSEMNEFGGYRPRSAHLSLG